MAPRSKFLDILNENAKFIKEGKFVKGDEDSELPPMGDEEDVPEEPQGGEEEQPQPQPEEEPEVQAPETTFTDREQDILNVAVQIYRANPENTLDTKHEFGNLFEQGRYEELLGRLIAIVDELSD